jgi:hypothetical protein
MTLAPGASSSSPRDRAIARTHGHSRTQKGNRVDIHRRVLVALAGAVLVSGVGFAHTAAADRRGAADGRVVHAVMVFDIEAHAGATFNVGDNFTTVGRVVSVDGRSFDGRLAFSCQITDVAAGAGACMYFFYLPGGEVTGSGDVRDGVEFPITGGTADYAGASGTVLITHTSDTGPRQAVFRLQMR